jgi:hypothetical protein
MDDEYRANVKELAAEFARFNPYERSYRYIAGLAKKGGTKELKALLHPH